MDSANSRCECVYRLAIDKNFDYKLREICNNLEKGKEQLVDKIKRGRIKDKKLMEISLNVHDDIVMTLKRWNWC